MVAKLSSVTTILAALLATSVPVMPIATPTSARASAGASLTPSPVIATTSPRACSASTMRSFCAGCTRAKTAMRGSASRRSASPMRSSSRPSTARSPSRAMPSLRAIARPVSLWSPVTITGRMPAARHSATATLTSSRGGSIWPTRPSRRARPASASKPAVRDRARSSSSAAKASTAAPWRPSRSAARVPRRSSRVRAVAGAQAQYGLGRAFDQDPAWLRPGGAAWPSAWCRNRRASRRRAAHRGAARRARRRP